MNYNKFKSNNDNIMFSKLNLHDIHDILFSLENYYLKYRDKLYLDSFLTFGIEIEFEQSPLNLITRILKTNNLNNWITKPERSIITGGEINSPILKDNDVAWRELKQVCTILKESGAIITENCGGHIHIGSNILGADYDNWLNFIKCIIAFERVLFRFGYGEFDKDRRGIRKYAYPVSYLLKQIINSNNIDFSYINAYDLVKIINDRTSKRNSVNLKKVNINTLEYKTNNTVTIYGFF